MRFVLISFEQKFTLGQNIRISCLTNSNQIIFSKGFKERKTFKEVNLFKSKLYN